ncbi:hypothetical protein [Microbispora sp. NPDC049633]|uniref:hypothetical protein n=1 Tax=Microbispora sp. NPDC049633 TaxID=3154355 RepID=UPI0034343200
MADKTSHNFPKVGTSVATNWTNTSGNPQRGTLVPKHGPSMVEAALAGNRRNVLERLGHKGAVQVPMYSQNAPEASATQRNVYTVPSKAGLSDFWAKRQYGQVQQ